MRAFLVSLVFLALAPGLRAQDLTPEQLLKRARTVLARVEGEVTLPGLREPVEVLRDRWGIPHIYAKNQDDLFFAQGFVAAQDRLFQIDLWRRRAVGEMAEVVGPDGIPGDRFARLVRYRGDMDAEWQSYSPDTKRIATAFTRGINACIDHMGDRLPIEFQLLGTRPKKWQPEDILGRMSGIIMTDNWTNEVARARLIAAVGVGKARWLAPTDPRRDFAPAPGLDLAGVDARTLAGYEAAIKALPFKPSTTQSNNWAIAGHRSASGKPLLASDPHRGIALPSLRYLVHLHAPGWNVIGSGEPGLPGVAIGHNERIAWGFTIVCTDQADVVVETLHPEDDDRYRVGDGWEKVRTVREQAAVKGQPRPTDLELRFTRNGPIVHEDRERRQAFALKWVGSEPGTAAYLGALAVGRARSWQEYLGAMRAWKIPDENMIYADVDGNIGWVAAALTPVRRGHDGLLPIPARSAAWERFLSVDQLPQEHNPARGYIATSNHNILPGGYGHTIGFEFASPYRYQRVKARLDAKTKLTLEDCRDIQHDVTSLPGQALVRLARGVKMGDPALEAAADVLRRWDGVLARDAQAGPLHAAWMMQLRQDVYRPHVPKDLLEAVHELSGVEVMLHALENPDEKWFGPDPKAARDRLLRTSFAAAVARVRKELGPDPSAWSWGRLHTVTFRNPLTSLGVPYAKAFDRGPVGRPGDALTPNNTRHNERFEQMHGATYRHVLDLADWDRGLATSAPGQSGQPGSPHYDDLLPLWAEGEYFPLAFSRGKVEEVTRHRLRLAPWQK